jgi:hypothetical protein
MCGSCSATRPLEASQPTPHVFGGLCENFAGLFLVSQSTVEKPEQLGTIALDGEGHRSLQLVRLARPADVPLERITRSGVVTLAHRRPRGEGSNLKKLVSQAE